MTISVQFWSYYRDKAGCTQASFEVPEGTTLGELQDRVGDRFPALAGLRTSTLAAVGVEYQPASYVLRDGDAVSLFPPVQGG